MTDERLERILDEMHDIDQFATEQAWEQMQAKVTARHPVKGRVRKLLAWSSAAAALLLLFVWLQGRRFVVENTQNKVLVHVLPDASTVSLNKGARLVYARDFARKRDVRLEGEAFFRVQPDARHPFKVEVGAGSVSVLGTSFNVRSHREQDKVEVLVESGRVLLRNPGEETLLLVAGEFGQMDHAALEKQANSDKNYLAWYNKELQFTAAPLEIVLATLERSYHCSFEWQDSSILEQTITSTYHDLDLEQVLQSMCLTLHLNYEKREDVYFIAN